jgi:hypothetical protein
VNFCLVLTLDRENERSILQRTWCKDAHSPIGQESVITEYLHLASGCLSAHPPSCFFFYFKIFETGSHYVAHPASNSWSSCYCASSAGIAGRYHHSQLHFFNGKLHEVKKSFFFPSRSFSFFLSFFNSFIHMCINCLGHFSPLFPTPTLSLQKS